MSNHSAGHIEINIERVIHPIGQGGFITEFIYVPSPKFKDSNVYKVIYDCGSETAGTLPPIIDRLFPYDSIVDCLFISHFDSDHVNGIDHLLSRIKKVRHVVLPLMNKMHKLVAFLTLGILSFDDNSLKARFKADQIIYIKPLEGEERNGNRDELAVTLTENGVTSTGQKELTSGTKINLEGIPEWIYIPFNVCEPDRYTKFLDFLKSRPDTEEIVKILEGDPDNYNELLDKKHREILSIIYKDFGKSDRNRDSLVVYSGPFKKNDTFEAWFVEQPFNPLLSLSSRLNPHELYLSRMEWLYPWWRERVAALYTGDINLNQGLQPYSRIKVIDRIKDDLQEVEANIGMIQIPHHGSKHNFTTQIFDIFPQTPIFFYAFGIDNTYGHPYSGIRFEMIKHHRWLFEVFEVPETGIYQLINE